MTKKHYLVYKTTCLVNGKIYIGQHQTDDINDGYLGSGKYLKRDIRNLGRENFKREILFDFDNFEDMDNKEKELVTEEFVARKDTYNVRIGGQNPDLSDLCRLGGLTFANRCRTNETYRNNLCKKKSQFMKEFYKKHPDRKRHIYFCDWNGRKHNEETKKKMSEKAKLRIGDKNGSFGTVWIYNECLGQNKKVKKEQVETFLNQGWKLGRKMKFHK